MEDNPNPNPNNDRDENERMSIDLPDSASNVQLLNMSETFQTPELRDLCRRLQRNDPELDSLEFENSGETPLGYGGPVGRALQGNTHVSHMRLDMDGLSSSTSRQNDEDVADLKPLLRYIQNGAPLESLLIENSGDHNQVEMRAVLEAAAASRFLTQVDFDMNMANHHSEAFCHLVENTRSILFMDVFLRRDSRLQT